MNSSKKTTHPLVRHPRKVQSVTEFYGRAVRPTQRPSVRQPPLLLPSAGWRRLARPDVTGRKIRRKCDKSLPDSIRQMGSGDGRVSQFTLAGISVGAGLRPRSAHLAGWLADLSPPRLTSGPRKTFGKPRSDSG